MIILAFIIAIIFAFAIFNYRAVAKMSDGTAQMKEIAHAIQEGANTFIKNEYRVIFFIGISVSVVLSAAIEWYVGISFVLGALMSASASWVGMKIATITNVRVANRAKQSKSLGATLKVAFRGGSVMGLAVSGFSLLGLGLVYVVFGDLMGQTAPENLTLQSNRIGLNFIPFAMTVSGYALGCSVIAMFNRVGGGIYTKAADMGADLVGKNRSGHTRRRFS